MQFGTSHLSLWLASLTSRSWKMSFPGHHDAHLLFLSFSIYYPPGLLLLQVHPWQYLR